MDQPRLLAKRSELGYVTNAHQAVAGEPEALTIEELQAIDHRTRSLEQRTWEMSRDRLLADLDHIRAHIHQPNVTRFLRAVEREIAAFDRKPL